MLKALRLRMALMLGGIVLVMASCGGSGGGDTQANGSGVGSGGTGSYTNGPVSGLGSIIVNKVRYDVSTATIHRDDDVLESTVHDAAEVMLGMVVEVSGSGVVPASDGGTPVATAYKVRYGSSLVGPISEIDSTASTITVLGQMVQLNTKTVQPASLQVGDVVEVYGLSDAAGGYTATRIDTATAPSTYKIVSTVDHVDSQFIYVGMAGGLRVAYGSVGLPAGVTSGTQVRIWFGSAKVNGEWMVTRIAVDRALVQDVDDARLEGLVTELPVNGVMKVDGATVDASRLSSVTGLTLGQRVRIEGRLQAGVLVAADLATQDQIDQDDRGVELHGTVSQLGSATFVVRGVKVAFNGSTTIEGGSLANGVCVEVHGLAFDASRSLTASEIEVSSGSCPGASTSGQDGVSGGLGSRPDGR